MTPPSSNRPPSISSVAFNCPHCGAFAAQTWFQVFGQKSADNRAPSVRKHSTIEFIKSNEKLDEKTRASMLSTTKATLPTVVPSLNFVSPPTDLSIITDVHLSWCFACKKVSIWVHDTLVSPFRKEGPPHHHDMPVDIAKDYDGSRTILKMSPRGAAALLRLCVQKLCDHLGQEGKKINAAIAALVADGLPPIVGEALDSVRVIGNESVHPGAMDLRDNQDTALKLSA